CEAQGFVIGEDAGSEIGSTDEDMPPLEPAQNELERLLNECSPIIDEFIQVVDYIDTVEDAVDWLRSGNPVDLIFMDIQLADGKSFEIFNQVSVEVPVIFTTAFDDYAIQAFKVNSIDYLLKPIGIDYLLAALDKFRKLHSQKEAKPVLSEDQIKQLLTVGKPQEYKKRFVATLGERIMQVPVEDIAYFYADDNTVFMVTKQTRKFVINYKLDQLSQVLDPVLFFRITRKYIANINSIKEINKYFNSRLLLNLEPPTSDEVIVSRAKVAEFMAWMDG
ncbi:MAG: LytR/AlgR family response regulator transcription factor, partial [Flammeovirgaceae bacterium]